MLSMVAHCLHIRIIFGEKRGDYKNFKTTKKQPTGGVMARKARERDQRWELRWSLKNLSCIVGEGWRDWENILNCSIGRRGGSGTKQNEGTRYPKPFRTLRQQCSWSLSRGALNNDTGTGFCTASSYDVFAANMEAEFMTFFAGRKKFKCGSEFVFEGRSRDGRITRASLRIFFHPEPILDLLTNTAGCVKLHYFVVISRVRHI